MDADANTILDSNPGARQRLAPLTFTSAAGVLSASLVEPRCTSRHQGEILSLHDVLSLTPQLASGTRLLLAPAAQAVPTLEVRAFSIDAIGDEPTKNGPTTAPRARRWLLVGFVPDPTARVAVVVESLDPLTSTATRRGLDIELPRIFQRCRGHLTPTLMMMDIDQLKTINDGHGHLAGDSLLSLFTERIRRMLRPDDFVARFGGDEFVVILQNVETIGSDPSVARIANRLLAEINVPAAINDELTLSIRCSIGIAGYSTTFGDHQAWLAAADRAMYAAKQSGGNRYAIWSPAGPALG